MTNSWSCVLDAAATVVGCEPEDLIEFIGHDGSEIIYPGLKDPANRKGFHIQEILDAVMRLGYGLIPIEARPVQIILENHTDYYEVPVGVERFYNHLKDHNGIIIGKNPSGLYHAVAWVDNKIIDPIGRIYGLDSCKFDIKIFWRLVKISISL